MPKLPIVAMVSMVVKMTVVSKLLVVPKVLWRLGAMLPKVPIVSWCLCCLSRLRCLWRIWCLLSMMTKVSVLLKASVMSMVPGVLWCLKRL